jgi:hypothetical protein
VSIKRYLHPPYAILTVVDKIINEQRKKAIVVASIPLFAGETNKFVIQKGMNTSHPDVIPDHSKYLSDLIN